MRINIIGKKIIYGWIFNIYNKILVFKIMNIIGLKVLIMFNWIYLLVMGCNVCVL